MTSDFNLHLICGRLEVLTVLLLNCQVFFGLGWASSCCCFEGSLGATHPMIQCHMPHNLNLLLKSCYCNHYVLLWFRILKNLFKF